MNRTAMLLAMTLSIAPMARSQDSTRAAAEQLLKAYGTAQVRTFMLKYMDPGDAAKLVTPYVDHTPGGGVYSAGSVRGITVRGNAAVLARVDSLLKVSDLQPESVKLNFQVIAAYDSAVTDASIAAIAMELHRVLRFGGYRSIASGSIIAAEGVAETSLGAGACQTFPITALVKRIDKAGGTVRLEVIMRASAYTPCGPATENARVLSTGLTIPFGQQVMVGTGAPLRLPLGAGGSEPDAQRAVILVVRAEPAPR